MMNQPSLGQLLRDLRRAAGLTQEELAAGAGLSTRAISDLERGVNHTPRTTTIQLLIGALRLSDREREHFVAVARVHERSSSHLATTASSAEREPAKSSTSTGVAPETPLIGRAREWAVLEQHLAGDGPPLLVIAGEPGIGKTRLLQEAAGLGVRLQMNVLRGSVPSAGFTDSLDPIEDALRNALQNRSPLLLRRDLQGCAALVHLLPELTSLDCVEAEPAPERMHEARTANAVLRFIANTAGPAGTLLTLDNLHDAGAPGLALLARLVRSSNDLPVRIVAAYRDGHCTGRDSLSALLAGLVHEGLVRHLKLSSLSTREAADLLTTVASQRGQTLDPWPARALHDSGGVPLYIIAWAEYLDLLRQQYAENVLPWPIQQSVRFRMDEGPSSVRPLLEALATTGGRATHAVLEDLVARPHPDLEGALDWSIRERLVAEEDQVYAFAYGVIRTAVAADLSPGKRQLIRRRLAALAKRHGESLSALDRSKTEHGRFASNRTTPRLSNRDNERAFHLAVLRHGRTAGGDED